MDVLPFTLDKGSGWRSNLGLILLQTDVTLEMDMRRFINFDGVNVLHTRIPSAAEVTPDTLSAMQHDLVTAAGLLPRVDFDVIGYGCTSASAVLGEDTITSLIQQAHPNAKVTNPASATICQLQAEGAQKIAVVTPYTDEVTSIVCDTLEDAGLEVVALASFNEEQDDQVARISEKSVYEAILHCGRRTHCDAVFASCTNLRVAGVYQQAESELGTFVTSSNRALAWHMLQLAGIN